MADIAATHVLWPDGTLSPGVVTVDGGRITALRRPDGPVPDRILAPGFVDLQVNGHDDVDVSRAEGSDWDRIDAALVSQGVTTWCPTLVTAPPDATAAGLARIEIARQRGGVRPTIAGAHLEGPFLGRPLGAHRAEHVRAVDHDAVATLPDLVKVVTLAPEVDGALDAITALADRGVLVALGHSAASFELARAAVDAGARLVTHAFNAMPSLHHRDPGLIGVALGDDRLAISLIADLVHVHPAVLRIAARSKPRGALILVTDAVAWAAGGLSGRRIEVVDGAPRLPDGTLAGSALTMDQAIRNAVSSGATDVPSALMAAATNPARLLGLDDRGTIALGARADLVALDHGLRVRSVWIEGHEVGG